MPPDQTSQSASNYDFILNSNKKTKRFIPTGGDSLGKRLIIVVGGFFLLILIFIVFKNFLSSSSINTNDYLTLLQDQSEILHILNTDITSQTTTNLTNANQAFLETTSLSFASFENTINSYLHTNKVHINSGLLSAHESSTIDGELSAQSNVDNINSLFQSIMQSQLSGYASDLAKAYSDSKGPIGRSIIKKQYDGTQLLLLALKIQYS